MDCPYLNLFQPVFHQGRQSMQSMVDTAQNEGLIWIESDKRSYWAVFSSDLINYISRRPDYFSSEIESSMPDEYCDNELAVMRRQLINMDPPKHNKYRRLIAKHFTEQSIAKLEPILKLNIKRVFDNFTANKRGDFVKEIAKPIPYRAILAILGLSQQHFEAISSLVDQVLFEDKTNASSELFLYVINCLDEVEDDSTIIHSLKNQTIDGLSISFEDLVSYVNFLLIAGTSSTQAAIAHAMRLFIEYPNQFDLLCENPSLVNCAVEEVLLYSPSFICMRRTAISDVKLGDIVIKDGDKVVMFYTVANHQNIANSDTPREFDITRTQLQQAKYIKSRTFGSGEHSCIGNQLARIELKIVLEQMITSIRNPRFMEPPKYFSSNHLSSIKQMKISFDVI